MDTFGPNNTTYVWRDIYLIDTKWGGNSPTKTLLIINKNYPDSPDPSFMVVTRNIAYNIYPNHITNFNFLNLTLKKLRIWRSYFNKSVYSQNKW
jgi:hypothetical protein